MRLAEFTSEEESAAIAKTAQDLVNPPVKMQHRARRDQEREQTYQNAQRGRNDDDDLDESAGNIGKQIKALYQKIYDQGDDSIDYMYHESPVFAQYWDEYEGELDEIIANVDLSELQIIHDELEAYLQGPGLAEGTGNGYYYLQGKKQGMLESKPKEKEADYGPEYQEMVARVKKLAGLGPLKTVWDEKKRVYKNVPVAVQPAQQPRKEQQ